MIASWVTFIKTTYPTIYNSLIYNSFRLIVPTSTVLGSFIFTRYTFRNPLLTNKSQKWTVSMPSAPFIGAVAGCLIGLSSPIIIAVVIWCKLEDFAYFIKKCLNLRRTHQVDYKTKTVYHDGTGQDNSQTNQVKTIVDPLDPQKPLAQLYSAMLNNLKLKGQSS